MRKPTMLPTFDDGYRSACLIDAMLRSHAAGGVWEKVQYVPSNEKIAQLESQHDDEWECSRHCCRRCPWKAC